MKQNLEKKKIRRGSKGEIKDRETEGNKADTLSP